MSLETILKNIYGYAELLQTVCTDKVRAWTVENLQDALSWARYCEQVHEQAQGKPYAEQLALQVRRIDELPWAIGGRHITLETLKQAGQVLKQALLQNAHLSDHLYGEVLCSYGNPKQVPGSLIKDIVDLSSVHQASQVATLCLQTEKTTLTVERVELYSSAEILLNYAVKLMNCRPDRRPQCQKILAQKLVQIGSDKEGLEVIAMACCLPSVKDPSSLAQTELINWLMDSPHKSSVLRLAGPLLAEVSLVHFVFYKLYIEDLISVAQRVQPTITKAGLLTYRLPGDLSYADLVSRFCALMRVGEPVRSATVNTVQALCNTDSLGIWTKLAKRLAKLENFMHSV